MDYLDVNNDFVTMGNQVSCVFDLESHEYLWYLYHFSNQISIGEGKVAAFQLDT